MSPPINRPFIDPTCPSGGSFYVCSDQTRFLGCCEVSACAHACSAGAIQPASFNASFWGNFSDQQCSAGRWFTCAGTNPPFMGCCKTNPCSQGRCPQDDLAPAHLSNNSAAAADFLPPPSVPSLSSATSSASASTAAASNITDQKTTKGVIIGASIGGAAGLILSLALLGFLIHRSKAKSRNQLAASQDVSAQVTYPETTQIGELDDGDESKHSVSNLSPGSKYTSMYSPATDHDPHATCYSELDSPESPSRFSAQPSYELPSPPVPSSPQPPNQPLK